MGIVTAKEKKKSVYQTTGLFFCERDINDTILPGTASPFHGEFR